MQPTGGSVAAFLADITPAVRRRDAETLTALLSEISGREPVLWGTIVGFGSCHYRYPTGTEGDMPVLAFAPRKSASTVYLDRAERHREALERLGPHTTGAACLYIKDLEKVDQAVLRGVLERTMAYVDAGGDEYAEITVTG
ncbi:DUF1801 domain-containing protein [Microbacterium sp. MC2]